MCEDSNCPGLVNMGWHNAYFQYAELGAAYKFLNDVPQICLDLGCEGGKPPMRLHGYVVEDVGHGGKPGRRDARIQRNARERIINYYYGAGSATMIGPQASVSHSPSAV